MTRIVSAVSGIQDSTTVGLSTWPPWSWSKPCPLGQETMGNCLVGHRHGKVSLRPELCLFLNLGGAGV